MFKRIFLAAWLVSLCPFAFAGQESDVLNLAGAGVIVATSPYDGVKTKSMAMPFLSAEYKDFYIRGVEAGYHFLKNEDWTLSAVVSPRLMGYSSQDSSSLRGMEDRQRSLDAGLKADYNLPWQHMVLGGKILADVCSRSGGMDYELALRRPFKGRIFHVTPSLGVRYQDKSLVDYYYGVGANEARLGRPSYAPSGAVNAFGNVAFTSGISEKIIVVTMFGVESLGREIRQSPLVDKTYLLTAVAGVTYRF